MDDAEGEGGFFELDEFDAVVDYGLAPDRIRLITNPLGFTRLPP